MYIRVPGYPRFLSEFVLVPKSTGRKNDSIFFKYFQPLVYNCSSLFLKSRLCEGLPDKVLKRCTHRYCWIGDIKLMSLPRMRRSRALATTRRRVLRVRRGRPRRCRSNRSRGFL